MLQGVHLLAHQAIGDAFQGDSSYSVGLDSLFRSELGRESLITFFEVTGVLLLSVICPPAGFLAGAVVAGAGVVSAYGDQTLYRSLIDPEVLMSRADMELELFMAEFGAALAIIPDAGSIISKAMQAGKTIGRTSVSTGLRITARRLSRELMATMAAQLRNGLVKELVVRVVTDQIMGKVISQVMEPAIKVLSEELSLGSAGAPAAVRPCPIRLRRLTSSCCSSAWSRWARLARTGTSTPMTPLRRSSREAPVIPHGGRGGGVRCRKGHR